MTEKLGEWARSWWLVVVSLAGFAAAWGVSTAQISGLYTGVHEILMKQEQLAADISRIGNSVAADGARTQSNIADIAELRVRVHELEVRR